MDLFQKAMGESDDKAIDLLYYSLEYDSTFSRAYISIARRYWIEFIYKTTQFGHLKDSVVKLTEKALHFDPQLAEAYLLKGYIYRYEGRLEEAISMLDHAIYLNPNMADAYQEKGWLYFGEMDYVNAIENFHQGILRDRTPGNLSNLYDKSGFVFASLGFKNIALDYYEEARKWHGDTAWHFYRQAQAEQYAGNYARALELALKGYEKAPDNNYGLVILAENYLLNGRFEESFKYFSTYVDIMEKRQEDIPWHKMPIAFSYLKNGYNEKAEHLIADQISQAEEWIEARRTGFAERYYYLAMAYLLKQDKERAIENLRLLSSVHEGINVTFTRFPENPIFYIIKDDPEFLEICDVIQNKYLAEHERVRKWLEENDML
jgi:tetratricopeptide (TPR) repeat protein